MKLRTAFVLSLLAVIVVMAIPALFGVLRIQEVRRIALDLRERTAEAALVVGRIQASLERLDRFQRAHVATGDDELAARGRAELASLATDLERLRESGYGTAVEDARFPFHGLQATSTLTALLMESGHREQATVLLRSGLADLLGDAETAAGELAAAIDRVTAVRVAEADELTADAVATTTIAFLLALLIAGGLAILSARVITEPLHRLSTAMSSVAEGDFDPPENLPYERPDEVGSLFRAFRSMALRLADLNRMKAQLVALASHDLKTPVNVISGYTELMSEELEPALQPRHRRIMRALQEQSRTLSTRLDQLMELSRIEASGLRLGLERIDIRHMISEIRRVHAAAAGEDGIEVETTVEPSTPTFLIADPDCLRVEVFDNLIGNAVRFTPSGGKVEVRASGHGGLVTFQIRDTGPSIDAGDLPHVFDKYYAGRSSSGRLGAGLGLPIARAGIEAHGGAIEVLSPSEDEGVVFRFTLPIHPTLPGAGEAEGDSVPLRVVGA